MAKDKRNPSGSPEGPSEPSPAFNPAPPEPSNGQPSYLPPSVRCFFSRTVRHAGAMCKHVRKLLHHQRDLLSPQAVAAVNGAMDAVKQALDDGAGEAALGRHMENLENAANKWLKPYPHAGWRENIEVLLVALTVAMGIRTFFLQPFKIPTGSMQPTLFGVNSQPDFTRESGRMSPEVAQAEMEKIKLSSGWQRVGDWFAGVSQVEMRSKVNGELQDVEPPYTINRFRAPFIQFYQTLEIGGVTHWMFFPPDYGGSTLEARAGLQKGYYYHTNDLVFRMKIVSGDHLFVDRLTYNFSVPRRGDIVVFPTSAIENRSGDWGTIPPDQFYIKRLVGLGGETLKLSQDYTVTNVPPGQSVPVGHLVVNGTPLSASTKGFQNVYSFPTATPGSKDLPYKENGYFGHAMMRQLSPGQEFHVESEHAFVMGDNTLNSLDSRFWGNFSQSAIIGKAFFVYWPLSKRFGWGYH